MPPRRRSSPVVTVQRPDREAWLRAVNLANGDLRLLRVVDERTVVVLNRPA